MTRKVIDIVIPWVDGDDPVLAAKRRQYLTGKREDKHADVAAATRYCDLGEIFWCIDSINIFAPFIRKIFIVTDGQDPHLEEHLTAVAERIQGAKSLVRVELLPYHKTAGAKYGMAGMEYTPEFDVGQAVRVWPDIFEKRGIATLTL